MILLEALTFGQVVTLAKGPVAIMIFTSWFLRWRHRRRAKKAEQVNQSMGRGDESANGTDSSSVYFYDR